MDIKLSKVMKILNQDEETTRKMLNKVGADLDEQASDPNIILSREEIAALATEQENTREGQLLSALLKRPPGVGT